MKGIKAEPEIVLPENPQTKGQIKIEKENTSSVAEETTPTKIRAVKRGQIKIERGNTSSVVEETTPTKITADKRGQTNIRWGNRPSAAEKARQARITICNGNKSSAAEETTSRRRKDSRPFRMFFWDGPNIHRRLAVEYGVTDMVCAKCGKVGDLSCYSTGFRAWGFRRVTEREMNQKCPVCKELKRNCQGCRVPFVYQWEGIHRRVKRIYRCGFCRSASHNRRTCPLMS